MITMTNKCYIKKFDKKCKSWSKDPQTNYMLLKRLEDQFNDILKDRGYVFLRDVYEVLGIPLDLESVTRGWFYSGESYYRYGQIEFEIFQNNNDIDINFLNVEYIVDKF